MQPPTGRRVSLTRTVAAATGVIFTIAAALLSYFAYNKAVDDLRYVAEQAAVSHNRLFVNLIWPHYRGFVSNAGKLPPQELQAHSSNQQLMRDVHQLAAGTQILKVKLFDTAGLTVFSTEAAQIGSNSYTSPGLQAALAGRVDSRLGYRESFTALHEKVFDLWVVSSYLPVRSGPDGPIEGVMEVYSDVSDAYALVRGHVLNEIGMIAAVMGFVFVLVMLVVHRADDVIGRQGRENQQLAELMFAAERANRSKSVFLANMSHELRTPLNAIIGFGEMMKLQMFGPIGHQRYQEYAGHILDAGQHLLSVINAVLDLSKIEAGKMRLDPEWLDPGEIAGSTIRMIDAKAITKGLELTLLLAPGLPRMHVDGPKLRQILLNLIDNAVKFTPKGGRITLGVAPSETGAGETGAGGQSFVDFDLRDTGIGMRREDIATALAPFGQIDNIYSRQHEGTGLGLPLSKSLAELMGGTLHIDSIAGQGTHIRVTLPVEAPAKPGSPGDVTIAAPTGLDQAAK